MDSKKRDVFWLIILRLIILTALFISAISIQFSTSTFLPLNAFYYVIIIAYALSLLYLALYFWDHHYIFQAGIQIFFDLFWITAVVYISGGVRGSFYFLYIFAIIAASVVISNRAAYLTACLSAVLFGLLANGMFLGLIPNYGADITDEISLGIVINNIIIAGCVFVLVAFLINYVSSNLRKTRKALEMTQRELEMKKWLAVAGEVSARVAHEIRNPLAGISGAVQILREELQLDEQQRDLMNIVIRESERVSQSIEQFLNLALAGKDTFSSIELSSILDETLTLLMRSGELNENYKIGGNYSSEKIMYFGNSNQFKQIFWNLIKNSLKAMPEGGELQIDFTQDERSSVELRFKDQGKGMEEEEKKRLFEPYYSGFKRGNGIGLVVVHRIVDEYRGKIEIFSGPDTGTEVVIKLPPVQTQKTKKPGALNLKRDSH